MRVLVVGGGAASMRCAGRSADPWRLSRLFCAPGNAGIAEIAACAPIAADDVAGLVAFAEHERIDLVVVGPEAPLVAGLADACAAAGLRCFGPTAAAARLEGSKAFMKEVAAAAGIPTAAWARFEDAAAARDHLRAVGAPVVVKADGLAAGKGVVVAATLAEAEAAVDALLAPDHPILIEEALTGPEVSLFALCDGTTALSLGAAADHKRVGEGDTGPNTGGMGAFAPAPLLTPVLERQAMDGIVRPALAELARRGTPFRGVLFAGLMLTPGGPKLLEFNVRFGDPECQALLPRLRSDLLAVLVAACDGALDAVALDWAATCTLGVVMATRGYPGPLADGGVIGGLAAAAAIPGALIFHSGTALGADGALVAAGGRVLTLVGQGATPAAARAAAYAAVDAVDWPGGFCRRDIGGR